MQQNSAHFEEGVVRAIQPTWQTFDEWKARASAPSQEILISPSAHLAALSPDHEWIQFAARADHLTHPETPLRDPELISYPPKSDPSVIPAHTDCLERKKRLTRTYTEGYFVLTPAGFLHEFSLSDPSLHPGQIPSWSLFLPECTRGPASHTRTRVNKVHIERSPDGRGTIKTGSFSGLSVAEGTKTWSFRARGRDDMMEWWNDIRMLCSKYFVASEPFERTGPAQDAVRSVGYLSGEMEPAGDTADVDTGEAEQSSRNGWAKGQWRRRRRAPMLGTHSQTTTTATNPIGLATAPPPVQSTYGQTRLRSPPPPAAHEAHAAAAEEDEEGMYASEEPGEEAEQGRVGNLAPVAPARRARGGRRGTAGGCGSGC